MLDLVKLDVVKSFDLNTISDLLDVEIANRIAGDILLQTNIDNLEATVTPYALFGHQTASDEGGTFTSGDWRVRTLNDTVLEESGSHGVTASSNQLTIPADSLFLVRWSAPAWNVSGHMSRLYNVTNADKILNGTTEFSTISQTRSVGYAAVSTITSGVPEVIQLEHQCEVTGSFGKGSAIFAENLYSWVRLERII